MAINGAALVLQLEAINSSITALATLVMNDRRERQREIQELSKAINESTREIRTVLGQAGKAPSESQELDVSTIRTPIPPRS